MVRWAGGVGVFAVFGDLFGSFWGKNKCVFSWCCFIFPVVFLSCWSFVFFVSLFLFDLFLSFREEKTRATTEVSKRPVFSKISS